ncbi:MAG: 50S ribosomal protein L9 [Planctomycetota bacterium]|nr:50S ribosomal protein L9 [Planctomycetota bacterium]
MSKSIELLLTETVDNLGIVGDVVKVRSGYARNFLLPRALATKPTPGAIKRLAERRAEVERELKARRAILEGIFEKLQGHEITVQRSANEQGVLFGGVSQHEIADALKADGFTIIDDRMVRIGQQIKRLDSYQIPIVLASDMKTEIKLWVVSDKPSDQLGNQGEPAAQAPAEAAAPTAAEEGEKPKRKKSEKAPKAEAAPEAPKA